MPMTFPAHQGLILPVTRRCPQHFDALVVSVGAAMPDLADSALGIMFNGYFKQWYGHSLIGVILFDFPAGLLLTYLLALVAARYLPAGYRSRIKIKVWSFSMIAGILSHLAFDFIAHETSWLLYPWYKSGHYLPQWWYVTWFKIHPPSFFGDSYSVGPYTLIWGILTAIGIILFFQYINPKNKTDDSAG
jgi:hypothetical protein